MKLKENGCEHCSVTFSAPGNLREHVKVIHLGIREYRCDECGYEMSTKSNLKKHLIQMNHSSKLEKVPIGESLLSQLNMSSGNISNTENSENPETTPSLASKTSNQIVNNNNEPVSPSTSISPSNTNNSRKQKRKRNITTDMGGPNKKFKESENDVEIIYNPPNLNQFNQFECPD